MSRAVNLTASQEDALRAVTQWREHEREAIEAAKQRMWDEINAGPRAMVAYQIREALALGVSERQIRLALGNKNPKALEPYLGRGAS